MDSVLVGQTEHLVPAAGQSEYIVKRCSVLFCSVCRVGGVQVKIDGRISPFPVKTPTNVGKNGKTKEERRRSASTEGYQISINS